MDNKVKILFLCTGNSCRSQMAEGWANTLKSDQIEAYSAGVEMHGLNPNAVKVMQEVGIDITNHKSQHVDELLHIDFDFVVTVCDNAQQSCPVFPANAIVIHKSFDDPPKMAALVEGEQRKLNCYRIVRDQIKDFIETLPNSLYELELEAENTVSY